MQLSPKFGFHSRVVLVHPSPLYLCIKFRINLSTSMENPIKCKVIFSGLFRLFRKYVLQVKNLDYLNNFTSLEFWMLKRPYKSLFLLLGVNAKKRSFKEADAPNKGHTVYSYEKSNKLIPSPMLTPLLQSF